MSEFIRKLRDAVINRLRRYMDMRISGAMLDEARCLMVEDWRP